MVHSKRSPGVLLVALFTFSALAVAEQSQTQRSDAGPRLVNWNAPVTYSPPGTGNTHPMNIQSGELGNGPFPFFPITPCRQYNSLSSTVLLNATPRTVLLSGAPCGIPSSSLAISVNITVFSISGATGNGVFKVGIASPPTTAWINYPPSETQRANAGVVSTDGSGNIVVQVNQGAGSVNFTVDVNGYYYNGNTSLMPLNDYFGIVGDYNLGGGVLFGENTEGTAASSYGVNGATLSTGTNSAGVHGLGLAASGVTIGVMGENVSTSGSAMGVLGQIDSATPGGFSAGVRGINNSTGGNGFGVWGSQAGGGYGVYGTTALNGIGVFGTSNNGDGVLGEDLATSGFGNGVLGAVFSSSADANGVYGLSFATTGTAPGVRGDSASASGNAIGVLGEITSTAAGVNSAAVRGINNSTTGLGIGGFFSQAGSGFGVEGSVSGPGLGVIGVATTPGTAVYAAGDFVATGSKSFVEPHPTDASKIINYVSLEGRESGTYFRGSAQTVGGRAVITVPEDFRIVTDTEGLTVQLTPVGAPATMYVVSEDLNEIVVQSNQEVRFHYMINGVRKAFKDHQPIMDSNLFMPRSPDELMPAYLTEEAKQRLITNGTYNPDGTVNMATAERVGWTKIWDQHETASDAAARVAAAKAALLKGQQKDGQQQQK